MKTNVISILSEKGGIGKSTTTYNLAGSLAQKGYKVLCLDLDKQCNLSTTFGYLSDEQDTICDAIYRVTSGRTYDAHNIIRHSDIGVDFVPSAKLLNSINAQLEATAAKTDVLTNLFSEVRSEYDYILIDNKTSVDLLTVNGLVMSNYVLVLVEAGIYSFDGLSDVINDIQSVKRSSNPQLDILGILYNKSDKSKIGKEIKEASSELFGQLVFDTSIPYRHAMVEKAIELQKPCSYLKSNSLGIHYTALAEEVINRTGMEE